MIHHQNADAMVLASARLRGIPKRALARTMGQNHRKIIGKTKKSAFCVPYSVSPAHNR
jgi:hypothetical protein